MVEFTGERVVPGQVNDDLWAEHFARYAFARRFAVGRKVLDAGCGTGYGAAELAQAAQLVVGVDFSTQACEYAHATFPLPNVRFAAASCEQLPFADRSFDLIAAFEVIEHLHDYRAFLEETARILRPDGLVLVSTPNRKYYADQRAATGPNPFHTHEFDAAEFEDALSRHFAHVTCVVQNRIEAFAFYRPKEFWPVAARLDRTGGSGDDAHFFLAICSHSTIAPLRSFVYVPRAVNLLREREQHVRLLEDELAKSKAWLTEAWDERDQILSRFRSQQSELEEHNRWAQGLNTQLEQAAARVEELQAELAREQAAALAMAHGYEAKVVELEKENLAKTQWAQETDTRLTAEIQGREAELAECVRLLHEAEATIEERTRWAQSTESERAALAAELNAHQASRWIKLGRRLGLGPK